MMPFTSEEERLGRDLAEVMDEVGEVPGSNVEAFLLDQRGYVEVAQKLAARWKLDELRALVARSVPMDAQASGQEACVLVRTVGLRRLSDEGVLLPPVEHQGSSVRRVAVAVEVFVYEDRVGTDPARLPADTHGVPFDVPVRHDPSAEAIHAALEQAIPEPAHEDR